MVDIGSGAGLPGIPLAIARPDLTVTLVEPLERRVRFLLEMVDGLGLDNCRVVRGRAEEVVAECGDADVVTSRAVAPLHRLVGWSAPLARDGGLVLAMKGETAREELDRDRAAVSPRRSGGSGGPRGRRLRVGGTDLRHPGASGGAAWVAAVGRPAPDWPLNAAAHLALAAEWHIQHRVGRAMSARFIRTR